jgi:hypothetical protein
MARNDLRFVKGQGGLGRALPSTDHISGFIFFYDTLPSGFGTTDRIKSIFSVDDAENLGIVDTHTDETKATGGSVQITLVGGAGSVWTITKDGGKIATYTEVSGDAVADIATGLNTSLNSLTVKTGYTSTAATDTVSLVAPAKKGEAANAGLAATNDGTGTSSVTQFSSGVGSIFAIMHYHISEFFRQQPKGKLWVGIYPETEGSTYTGERLQTIQDYSEGEIKQFAVYNQTATYASSQVTASQTYADENEVNHKPHSVVLHSDMTGLSLSGLTALTSLDSEKVSVVIGEDGNWHQADYSNTKAYLIGDKVSFDGGVYQCIKASTGNSPYEGEYWSFIGINLPDVTGVSVSSLGTCLGTIALSAVHENIGWVQEYNLTSGNTLDVAGFATGVLYKDQSKSLLTQLTDYSYIYLRKHIGISGTYWEDSWTCTLRSSDYATIENNRTIDKATRLVRVDLLPKLSSPLYVNPDGTLTEDTIAEFKNEADKAMEQMEVDAEISAFEVSIDPAQDVLTTSKVVVSIKIVPVGVAREIEVNIGFVVNLNS